MRLRLIAAGTRLPGWIDEGVAEYSKRLRALKFELIEIPATRQAERMRAAIGPRDYIVAVDVLGRETTTPELSRWLAARQAGGRDLALLIGQLVLNHANGVT